MKTSAMNMKLSNSTYSSISSPLNHADACEVDHRYQPTAIQTTPTTVTTTQFKNSLQRSLPATDCQNVHTMLKETTGSERNFVGQVWGRPLASFFMIGLIQ